MFTLSRRAGALADRFGPRLFMGGGPLVAAAGLATAAARRRRRRLRRPRCCPPLLIFSLGLSVTVAPLTATVLADADENNAGIASGVNNAIARVAGLLAVAALGAVVAAPVRRHDRRRTWPAGGFRPAGPARSSSEAKDRTLARAEPDGLPPREARVVTQAAEDASVTAFHRGVGIAAALVALGRPARRRRDPQPAPRGAVRGLPRRPARGGPARGRAPATGAARGDLTRRQHDAYAAPTASCGMAQRRRAPCSACRARARTSLWKCRACRGAQRDAGPASPRGPRCRRSAPRRWAPSSACRWPSSSSPPSAPRSSRARPSAASPAGWSARSRTAARPARQPADAAGRLHPRARAPRPGVDRRRCCARRGPLPASSGRRWSATHVAAGARPAAVADRRLQLPALRAHAGALRPQPLHRAAAQRPRRTPPTTSPTGTTCPRPTARCSRCSPRGSRRSALPAAYWVWKAIVLAAALGTLAIVALRRAAARALAAGRGRARRPQPARARLRHRRRCTTSRSMLLCGVAAVALVIVGWRGRESAGWDVAAGRLRRRWPPASSRRRRCSRRSSCSACRRRLPALGGAGGAGALVAGRRRAGLRRLPPGDRHPGRPRHAAERAQRARRARRPRWDDARTIAPSPTSCSALAAVGATAAVAWRRAWLPGAAGFVMLATVLTLGWTMPWYVWWVLPFAALARTRALAGACVVLTAWLALGADPADAGAHPRLRLLPHAHGGGAGQPPLHPALPAMSATVAPPSAAPQAGAPARALRRWSARPTPP